MTEMYIDGGGVALPSDLTLTPLMEAVTVPVIPETFGATVQDVKARLLSLSTTPAVPVSNGHFAQPATTRGVTDEMIQQFIYDAAADVAARIARYDEVPERTQSVLLLKARAVVADGAAHYVQSALYPASASPNDGSAYAERLWERFQTRLDVLGQLYDAVVPTTPSGAGGGVFSSFPAPLFEDDGVF